MKRKEREGGRFVSLVVGAAARGPGLPGAPWGSLGLQRGKQRGGCPSGLEKPQASVALGKRSRLGVGRGEAWALEH